MARSCPYSSGFCRLIVVYFRQVERWMMKKAKDADAMNFENEQQTRYTCNTTVYWALLRQFISALSIICSYFFTLIINPQHIYFV
jgi:hypothetical protein